MPGTVEAALILLVLAGPGFIASRLLNSLVAYRLPTAFQETTQAIVFSAVLVPLWLMLLVRCLPLETRCLPYGGISSTRPSCRGTPSGCR